MSEGHHKQSFWSKYIWSTDHKVIGIQYGITSLVWLLFGFALMAIMRYQLAYPGCNEWGRRRCVDVGGKKQESLRG